MFDFLHTFELILKKHYKKLLPVFLSPVLMFLCAVPSYAASDKVYIESSTLVTWYNSNPNIRLSDSSNIAVFEGPTTPNNLNEFLGGNPLVNNILHLRLYNNSHSINFQYIPEAYDYWVSFTAFSETTNKSDFTFVPDRIQIFERNCEDDGQYTYYTLTNFKVLHNDDSSDIGFTVIGKLPDNLTSNSPVGFRITDNSTGSLGYNLRLQAYLYAVPKSSGASSADIAGIIAAIQSQTQSIISGFNSQTSSIVSGINSQTNKIMNEGSSFGSTVSGIQSGNNSLSGFIDDYTEVEQSMYDKFTENQTAVIGNFSGFAWGSLSTAVDWTSDYLNRIYDNSGDFRTMFMYPILAGIALIFIGRQGLTAYVRSRREK